MGNYTESWEGWLKTREYFDKQLETRLRRKHRQKPQVEIIDVQHFHSINHKNLRKTIYNVGRLALFLFIF